MGAVTRFLIMGTPFRDSARIVLIETSISVAWVWGVHTLLRAPGFLLSPPTLPSGDLQGIWDHDACKYPCKSLFYDKKSNWIRYCHNMGNFLRP